jgi:mannose-6-phosphate isomerase-like protein (cupin superfamily)
VSVEPLVFETAVDFATETSSEQFLGGRHGVDASFFLLHMEPGRGPSLHRHAYPEVFILRDGEATLTVDGAEYVARGGQLVIVPAGAAHAFKNTGSVTLEAMTIHPVPEMKTEWLEEAAGT